MEAGFDEAVGVAVETGQEFLAGQEPAHVAGQHVAFVLLGDTSNHLHDQDGFADAGTAEESDLAALHVRGEEVDSPACRQRQAVAGRSLEVGLPSLAKLNGPQSRGELGRQMDVDRPAALIGARHLGGQGAGGVDDDEIAFLEEAGQLRERRVHERAIAAVRDEQAHGVSRQAPRLWRDGRLELRREHETV